MQNTTRLNVYRSETLFHSFISFQLFSRSSLMPHIQHLHLLFCVLQSIRLEFKGLLLSCRFYLGTRPVVVVADPTLLDLVLAADCHSFTTTQQVYYGHTAPLTLRVYTCICTTDMHTSRGKQHKSLCCLLHSYPSVHVHHQWAGVPSARSIMHPLKSYGIQ